MGHVECSTAAIAICKFSLYMVKVVMSFIN